MGLYLGTFRGIIAYLILNLALLLGAPAAEALDTKVRQIAAMEAILAELEVHYGMMEFKEKMFGVTLDGLRKKYTSLIRSAKTLEEHEKLVPVQKRRILPPVEFKQLMIGMIAELRDGHVSLSRLSHDGWGVGLSTAMIDGRLYVTGLNKDLLVGNASVQEIQLGDEVVELNGVSVQELAKRQMIYSQYATYESRLMDALEHLLLRAHANYRAVKEGEEAELTLRRDGKTFKSHLTWLGLKRFIELRSRYHQHFDLTRVKAAQEEVAVPFGMTGVVSSYFRQGLMAANVPPGAIIDIGKLYNSELMADAQKAGGFQKPAGANGQSKVSPVTRLQAYIIRYENKNIGVLRVPSYSAPNIKNEIMWVAEILRRLENSVDVLVLDVLSNAGGSVHMGTRLLSMLAGEDSLRSIQSNTRLTETLLYIHGDSDAPTDPETGKPYNYGEDRVGQIAYEEWQEKYDRGERWSGMQPSFSNVLTRSGAGVILPDINVRFTKPLLVLNDNRSASGGDFIPAILQTNRRALVMGETSKGLGGPVYRKIDSMPGSEMAFRCTMAYCERADGVPIENIGVVPNLHRAVEVRDLKEGFKPFTKDVLDVALEIAKGQPLDKVEAGWKNKVAQRRSSHAAAQKLAPLREKIEAFKASPAFVHVEKDVKRGAPGFVKELKKFVEGLREMGKDLTPEEWHQLILPLPDSFVGADQILSSLWRRDEFVARLGELENVSSWVARKELLAMGRGVAEAVAMIPGGLRLADPCNLLLLSSKK